MPLSLPAALRTVCLAATLILSPFAAAADKRADAAELLRLVGFDINAELLSQTFSDVPDQAEGFSPEVIRRWPAIVAGRIDADRVYAAAVEAVARDVSAGDIATLTAFFLSDPGVVVTQAEVAAQELQVVDAEADAAARGAFLQTLDDSFRERFDLYRDLIEAMDAVDSGTTLAMNINYALISGMIASGLMDPAPSEEDILAMIAASEAEIRATVFPILLEDLAWTYRDVPDADMEAYVDLLGSPAGRSLYAAVTVSTNTLIIDAARAIGHEIMVQMGKTDL